MTRSPSAQTLARPRATKSAAGTVALALAALAFSPASATGSALPSSSTTVAGGGTAAAVRPPTHQLFYEIEARTHRWTLAQAVEHAKGYDVIIALRFSYTREMVAAMRKVNPSLRLVVYSNGTLAQTAQKNTFPDSWYLKDKNGFKIQNDWKLWLMDPVNPAWLQNRALQCQDFLAKSGYDSCYLDNMGYGFIKYNPLTGKPINPRTRALYTFADWQRDTIAATSYVAARVNQPVIPNGIINGGVYFGNPASKPLLTAGDGALAEVFLRTSSQSATWVPSTAAWKQDLSMLMDAARLGKPLHVTTKIWSPATPAQLARWRDLTYATFLIGSDAVKSTVHFAGAEFEVPFVYNGPMSRVGMPSGALRVTNDVYQRNFTNGIALVNPSGGARTLNLGSPYRTESGKIIYSITLAPMTGAILTR